MKNKLLTLITTMLFVSITASPVYASNKSSFVKYARVTAVEPLYRYITIYEPHKHCSYVKPSHSYNRHRQQRRFVSGESYTGNRISTGTQGLHGNDRRNYRQSRNNGHRNGHRSGHRNGHRSGYGNSRHHNRRVKHCVTTTVPRKERRLDGYYVTYVYKGDTFQTKTDYYPGDTIKVTVQVKPH